MSADSVNSGSAVREPDPYRVSRRSLRVRWRLLPWWVKVTLVYLAARVLTTIMVIEVARQQGPNSWTGAKPGYLDFASLWDARWYEIIGIGGYPRELPLADDGHVAENAWAFLPLYPGATEAATLLGLPWKLAAVIVAVTAGYGAALVLHRLMLRFLEPDRALFAVVLFSIAPVSPIMQFGYAESLGFLWVALALLLLVDRRYGWLVPVVLAWAFTRPGALAFALTLGLHFVWRWWHRDRDPFPPREQLVVIGVGLFTVLAGFAWPLIVWGVTGQVDGYTETELAWRSAYIGRQELVPLTPWFQGGAWWATWVGLPAWVGIAAVGVLAVGFAAMLFLPAVRRLGVDIRFWLASYGLYLFAVFFPQSSTFRILAPLFPIVGALAVPRARWYRWSIVLLLIALQYWWLAGVWRVDDYDWTPP
ncbi:hypothetical protein ACFWGP_16700 [Agromyces sp. NPDC127015]|uniref:hypothetical protein n=1 Tax=Agromyces sp. NPDC127015 TaxID=3347108 RepID=UPI003646AC5B